MEARHQVEAFPLQGGQPIHLTLILGGALFAVDILKVREIVGYDQLAAAPAMPEHIRGVVANLRGELVPVIDVARRCGLAETPVGPRTCIVVVQAEAAHFGLVASGVGDLLEIRPGQIEAPPLAGTAIPCGNVQGVARVGDSAVMILDTSRLLSTEELAALREALPAGGKATERASA